MKRLEIKDDGVYFKGRKLFFADELDLSGKAGVNAENLTEENINNFIKKLGVVKNAVVLWENPNPSSEFSTQTITTSQSVKNFTHIIYEWNIGIGSTLNGYFLTVMKTSSFHIRLFYANGYSGKVGGRGGQITADNNIYFENNYYAGSKVNSECIPLRILGVNL